MIGLREVDPEMGRYLAHSLWQGVVLLLAYLGIRRWLTSARPEVRCRVAGWSVVLLALLPLLNRLVMTIAGQPSAAGLSSNVPVGLIPVPGPVLQLLQRHLTFTLSQIIVLVWAIGVLFSLLRTLAGVWRLNRLLGRAGRPMSLPFMEALGLRTGLPVPEVREWAGASAPFVAGWLRPVIVLPVGLSRLLSAGELEAVLLHELAHVKRNDVRNNLGLRVIGSLAWYQLPLWKLMNDLARDREHCCDELAIQTMGKSLPLARALITLEERRSGQPRLAMAGTGGDFSGRVRRIVAGESGPRALPRGSAAVITILFAVTGSTLLTAASAEGQLAAWAENLHANIKANDPGGRFTVEMIGRRLISATIDGQVIPADRIVQRGEQVQMLDAHGRPQLVLEVPAPGRIHWSPRPPRSP